MAELAESNALALAEHLFAPTERWGWQFVDPPAARVSPDRQNEPRWVEPPPPDLQGVHARAAATRRKTPKRAVISGGLLLFGLMIVNYGGVLFIVVGLILGAVWFLPLLTANQAISSVQSRYEQYRREERERFDRAHAQWRTAVERWDAGERARRDAVDLWFPLELTSLPQRVDVFGGTPDGWSALLCTVGTTIMESGTPMFVIDFTEEDVTGPLCAVAQLRGFPARRQNVPSGLEAARLLEGLGAEQVAELIAESVDTMRRGGEDVELRMLDVELVQSVVTRLEGPVTFGRVAAGLLALQQGYDIDRDRRLTAKEFQRITEVVDTVAATERVRNEIQFLRGVLDMLPSPSAGAAADVNEAIPQGLWPESGLSVLRTEDDNRRRRDFVDRLMAQILLQRVRRVRNQNAGFVLVLAGADHLGQVTLELLARRCRQAGIRLVLLVEHLRGDLQQLLGGSDSVTFFMRLGNVQEAAVAAEHIGRGHTFLLTQLNRQRGETDTTGTSHTTGISTSTSTGTSYSRGRSTTRWSDPPTISRQRTDSSNYTTAESTQWGTNESRAISTTDGETVSRVYEFRVEPTQIQSLDVTSFLFVESSGGERRVAGGTCDPYVVLMPKVSRTPAAPQVRPAPGEITGGSQQLPAAQQVSQWPEYGASPWQGAPAPGQYRPPTP